MHALALLALLLQAPAARPVDLGRLLAERADPASRARRPEPAYVLRTVAVSPRPPAGGGESVLAEIEGPGALVLIETTAAAGTIRVRLDGGEDPVLAERQENGGILDLPIPFAARCRVTADGEDPAACRIEYRAYPAGTAVVSATRSGLESARTVPRPAPAGSDTFTLSVSEEIPEGGLTCIDVKNASGPRAVTRIHLRAEATDLAIALQRARLRLVFDGETTVDCPLGAFFGCEGGVVPFDAPDLQVAPGADEATGRPGTQVELVCRFVMPYRERFDLSIDAAKAGDLHVAGIVRTMPWEWDDRTLRFRAACGGAPENGEGVVLLGDVARRPRAPDARPLAEYSYAPPRPAKDK